MRPAATSTSASRASRRTAPCPGSGPTRSRSRSRTRRRRIPATSHSGRRPRRARTRPGSALGRLGRPGWHIECSAMAAKELGPEFWIHGGGLDLVFPHHENERAQSLSVGHPFARIWMHNGLLRFTGEKMSKSIGNVATIRDVLDAWGREAALVFFLTAHWRKPIDFSEETMAAAAAQAETLRTPAGRDAHERRLGTAGRRRSRKTSTRRRRSRSSTTGRARGRSGSCDAGSRCSVSRRSPTVGAARRCRRLAEGARPPGRCVSLPRRTGSEPRSSLPDGRCATSRGRPGTSSSPDRDARSRLRTQRGSRGAARPARRARGVGRRARGSDPRLAGRRASAPSPPRARADRGGRLGRPSGRGRVVRAIPLCGRVGSRLGRHAPSLLSRPGHRSSEPRRRRAQRGGSRRDGRRASGPRGGGRHPGRLPCVRGRRRTPPGRGRPESRPVSRRGEGRPALGVRGVRRRRRPLWDLDLTDGIALVFGAEGKGVRPLVRRSCDGTVAIPLEPGLESLNVSVAAAVALFEARRQRKYSTSTGG